MKRRSIWFCPLFVLLIASPNTPAFSNGQDLNAPPKPTARELVKRAVTLAEADKPGEALAAVKRALSISPDYLRAHIEYINIKSNFLGRYDEVKKEYEDLIRRHPKNAVYLMAVHYRSNAESSGQVLKKLVDLAPAWAWGHYAKALLAKASDPEKAAVELEQCIATDRSATEAYHLLIELQETRLRRIDEAIRTAERLAAETDIRPTLRLPQAWRLRLVKAQHSEESKLALRNELSKLANGTTEVDILQAIRSSYLSFLNDSTNAKLVEDRIRQLDSTWTPERGFIYTQIKTNQSGVPRFVVLVNRQIAISQQAKLITGAIDTVPSEKIRHLQGLLSLRPSDEMRRVVYEEIFQLAVRSRNVPAARKYGTILSHLDPNDSRLLAQVALVLADKKAHLDEALSFATAAQRLTGTFRSAPRPSNTPQSVLDEIFTKERQHQEYRKNRAAALDALGWVLVQLGRPLEGEPLLQQALHIEESEKRFSHLAMALEKLNRMDKAAIAKARALRFLTESIKKNFISKPVDDLQVTSIEGRSLKLSDLKGRILIVNFWASWCIPCRQEIPRLKTLFEKFRAQGLEIVAISVDEEPDKARAFAADNSLNFFISIDPALGKKIAEDRIPLSLFIDRTGTLRYRKFGYDEGDEREIELVINELLKEQEESSTGRSPL
jgi:thiol-disulfide isomerase/thioredoxin